MENKEKMLIEKKMRDIRYIRTQKKYIPVVQIVTETRIFKGSQSKYENSPSKEIKKWFVTRRI